MSLDAVEEQSLGFPERVTKSHLSRIETGKAVPTFPRVYTLSRIYGIPITQMAERFELDLSTRELGGEITDADSMHLLELGITETQRGRYSTALRYFEAGMDLAAAGDDRVLERLWIHRVGCLVHLSSFHAAKDEAERLLARDSVSEAVQRMALYYVAYSLHQLGRTRVARIIVQELHTRQQASPTDDRVTFLTHALDGETYRALGDDRAAIDSFNSAASTAQRLGLQVESVRHRLHQVDSMIQLGQLGGAHRIATQGVESARSLGVDRLVALGLSHLALIAFRREQWERFESLALQSNRLARDSEFNDVTFRNSYYLMLRAGHVGDRSAESSSRRTCRALLARVGRNLPERQMFQAYQQRSEA